MDMKTHIITHPDNNKKRYEFTPVVSPITRIRIRSYGFAGEERLDSMMQISVARAFWKGKVSEGWNVVTKTDNRISVPDDTKKKEKEWLDKFIDQHMKSAIEKNHCIDTSDMHSLYMKNKKKHDDDFFKNNYALEA